MNKRKSYVADFETTTNLEDCRVWCYSITEIGNEDNTIVGKTIEDFFKHLETLGNAIVFFHNLRFDAQFILYYILTQGYTHVKDKKYMRRKTFTSLISGLGVFYSIEVKLENGNLITFYDSLKKIPKPVKQIPKDFGLEEEKGEIDYNKERPVGYELTEIEKSYVMHDTIIVSKALNIQFNQGLDKMTIAGDAIASVKSMTNFRELFPVLSKEEDEFIRKSYRGGWTYCNPKFQNVDLKELEVYDVNSLYPSRMRYCMLPKGPAIYYKGKYIKNDKYPLYVAHIYATFKLKKGCLPCIQDKHNRMFASTEYICEYDNILEPLELYLTSVDLKLFLDMYDIYYIEYVDGYMFEGAYGMFDDYIDYWNNQKIEAGKEKNASKRTIAKLMLNSCYGKFASAVKSTSKVPFLKDDGSVGYETIEDEDREPVYTPVAAFITAEARDLTIRSAVACIDRFCYADTDSLHVLKDKTPPNIPIDDFKLGYFKLESSPRRARFLRAKTYIEEIYDDKTNTWKFDVKCAGMNDDVKKLVTWDNFHYGFTSDLKKKPKNVKGGVVIVNTPFTISEPK